MLGELWSANSTVRHSDLRIGTDIRASGPAGCASGGISAWAQCRRRPKSAAVGRGVHCERSRIHGDSSRRRRGAGLPVRAGSGSLKPGRVLRAAAPLEQLNHESYSGRRCRWSGRPVRAGSSSLKPCGGRLLRAGAPLESASARRGRARGSETRSTGRAEPARPLITGCRAGWPGSQTRGPVPGPPIKVFGEFEAFEGI